MYNNIVEHRYNKFSVFVRLAPLSLPPARGGAIFYCFRAEWPPSYPPYSRNLWSDRPTDRPADVDGIRQYMNHTRPSFCRPQFVCGFVLLWTLTLISMDRHRCIVVPPYRSQLTPRRATALTAFTWLIALAVFMPVPFWFHEQPVQDGTVNICTLVFPKNDTFRMSVVFTASVVSLSCVLPLSLFVYHYQRIFHKLNKTRRRIEQSGARRSKATSQNSLSQPPTHPDSSSVSQVTIAASDISFSCVSSRVKKKTLF